MNLGHRVSLEETGWMSPIAIMSGPGRLKPLTLIQCTRAGRSWPTTRLWDYRLLPSLSLVCAEAPSPPPGIKAGCPHPSV